MKKRLLLNFIVLISLGVSIGFTSKANSSPPSDPHIPEIIQQTQSADVLTRVPEANATLFAKKKGSMYEEFILEVNGVYKQFPLWKNVTTPTYAPKLFFDDINRDGKKEMTIVLTTGYGTELLQQEVHVLHQTRTFYNEVLVDNPLAIVLKNVKTKLSEHHAELMIEGHKTVVNIEPLQIHSANLFSDISLGNIVSFEVVEHELIATVGAQVSPAAYIGAIKIAYDYKDKMYQAKRIEFIAKIIE